MNRYNKIFEKIRSKYPLVCQTLGKVPGFMGLGFGYKEINGQLTDQLAWKVYVKEKKPINRLQSCHIIPEKIEKIPTDVISKVVSLPNYGEDYRENLVPGLQIASDVGNEGTLGCFARLRSDNSIVLLGNNHILYGGFYSEQDVGQPKVSCSWCCKCRVIATNVGDGRNGFNNVTVLVDDEEGATHTYNGSEYDCAIARLNGKRPYSNDIPGIGMISGTPPAGNFGVSVGAVVEKVGTQTGYTKGIIVGSGAINPRYSDGRAIPNFLYPYQIQSNAVVAEMAGAPIYSINQLIITPIEGHSRFADQGDSGAVVVNSARQVVGLIKSTVTVNEQVRTAFRNAGHPLEANVRELGVASPIHIVLNALNIEIPANLASTTPTYGNTIKAGGNFLYEEERFLQKQINEVREQVRQSQLGETLIRQMETHQDEIIKLVNRNRHVTVTWHRNQGPAYAAHCIKSLKEPGHKIPAEIKGISRTVLVSKMAEILNAYGSESLKTLIKTHLPLVLEYIDKCDTLRTAINMIGNIKK